MDLNLQPLLPASLRGHCRVTAVDGVTLEVTARQAAVATRLRYLVPQLLSGLHSCGYPQLQQIRVRVLPPS
ncbi:DciA family protein [Permianibacter fluminis]|uniref:DciA family protein n=1 Tax=Permianibacter fluminis TaxID=2738515 RepID=UPI0038B3B1DC